MAVLNNKAGGSALIHLTVSNTLIVVGNNSVSNLALTTETVSSATIKKVWWGASNSSYWTVARGSNTVLVLTESGQLDFSSDVLTKDSAANLVFTLVGTGVGFIAAEVKKN